MLCGEPRCILRDRSNIRCRDGEQATQVKLRWKTREKKAALNFIWNHSITESQILLPDSGSQKENRTSLRPRLGHVNLRSGVWILLRLYLYRDLVNLSAKIKEKGGH